MTCQSPSILAGASAAMQRAPYNDDNSSRNSMVRQCLGMPVSVTDWGFPGHLTEKEYAVYVSAVRIAWIAFTVFKVVIDSNC
jgi:hypothetical protein